MIGLQQESQRWQKAWKEEREKVKELESEVKQAAKREERRRLEHSQQLLELRHQLSTVTDQVGEGGVKLLVW